MRKLKINVETINEDQSGHVYKLISLPYLGDRLIKMLIVTPRSFCHTPEV